MSFDRWETHNRESGALDQWFQVIHIRGGFTMGLCLHVQISLSGHRGESMGEDEIFPLREYIPHHSTLNVSTFPYYP